MNVEIAREVCQLRHVDRIGPVRGRSVMAVDEGDDLREPRHGEPRPVAGEPRRTLHMAVEDPEFPGVGVGADQEDHARLIGSDRERDARIAEKTLELPGRDDLEDTLRSGFAPDAARWRGSGSGRSPVQTLGHVGFLLSNGRKAFLSWRRSLAERFHTSGEPPHRAAKPFA